MNRDYFNQDQAYQESSELSSKHYENFPVASFLVPKRLRKHISIIYRFAREADDLADEGNLSPQIRTGLLNKYENDLELCLNGNPNNAFWAALKNTVDELNITNKYLFDLLKAFKQDVVKARFTSFDDVLEYCRYSANPVGRIILEMFDIKEGKAKEYSDSICTALQLTNFLQDTAIDFSRGRIYIPLNELKTFMVSESDFELRNFSGNFAELIKYQVIRIEKMFDYGNNIIKFLPKRLALEIKWTILGGKNILDKIKISGYDVINNRPKLNKFDYIFLLIKSLR